MRTETPELRKLREARRQAVQEAIDKAGGLSALARLIGKSKSHVWMWRQRGNVPAELVIPIEEATGIPRHRLRPDVFKDEVAA